MLRVVTRRHSVLARGSITAAGLGQGNTPSLPTGINAWREGVPPALVTAQTRTLSYNFNNDFDDEWPITQRNTIINVCQQGERMVIERFGRLSSIEQPGWFIAIPLVDNIAYRIDMRERNIEISPQSAITKDNVSVEVSGNLYVQFIDPEKAAYGSANPLYGVRQHAQSSMRAAIGELELDEILHARSTLNSMIKTSVQGAADAWGMVVKRYEITDITPDRQISEAMDKQAAAERVRRERVLTAEGEKKAYTLKSEGVKIQLINESEGHLIQVQNQARANKERIRLEAEGEADARLVLAQAEAESIAKVAEALQSAGGEVAAQLQVAREYIEMYGEMGKQSNTMLFNERPADVHSLLAQAATVLASSSSGSTPTSSTSPEPAKSAVAAGAAAAAAAGAAATASGGVKSPS